MSAYRGPARFGPTVLLPWRIYVPALLCLVAGIFHLVVTPEHFAEAFSEGAFMLTTGLAQLVGALLLWLRPSRGVVAVVSVGTVLLLLLYVASRTSGLPFGPHPWQPEAMGALDLACKVAEDALLVALAAGWHRRPQAAPARQAASAG